MLDLVVQHHRQATPRRGTAGWVERKGERVKGGESGGAEDRKGEGSTAAVLTLVESAAREFERGQTEI